jgi:hypothetical protein
MKQSDEIESLIESAYEGVPSIDCSGCSGDCCVSPTMTAPEFVRMMHWARENFGLEKLTEILMQPSREHFLYADNAFCRFQDPGGLCTSYQGRAIACRLHGHEAMRAFASEGTEFCTRNPSGNTAMTSEQVEPLIENIRKALSLSGIPYSSPYFLISLNLECWLDFAYHPEWSKDRPALLPTRQYLDQFIELPKLPQHRCNTTLEGKLNTIDKLFAAIEKEDSARIEALLQELHDDFPSCGSYFLEELAAMKEMFRPSPANAEGVGS